MPIEPEHIPGSEFKLGTRPSKTEGWFDLGTPESSVLREKRELLAKHPLSEMLAFTPEAAPFIEEVAELVSLNGVTPDMDGLETITRRWEPDFAIFKRPNDLKAEPVMVAGSVCFPSSWDIRKKIGKGISQIHEPVPTVNQNLGSSIIGFMNGYNRDTTYERWNMGYAATPERNMHPDHNFPKLVEDTPMENVWVRTEQTGFHTLQGGILFMIRLSVDPFIETVVDEESRILVVEQLATMRDEVASYKGVSLIRTRLIKYCRSVPTQGD